ncbi:hypothetical protein IR141_10205, partial [Neisseria sp. 19428wB4_WF04]|nr:hypothetical protein [Neisseria sp. 19428wB4_WF04]
MRRYGAPLSNRGGAETAAAVSAEQEAFEKYTHFLTDSKGRLLEIPLRRGKADSAFIDQISFSIHEDTLSLLAGYPLVSDDEYIVRASMELSGIFGFGITEKAKHTGGRFYDSCWLVKYRAKLSQGNGELCSKIEPLSVCYKLLRFITQRSPTWMLC